MISNFSPLTKSAAPFHTRKEHNKGAFISNSEYKLKGY